MKDALRGGQQLTRAELAEVLEQADIDTSEGRLGHFPMYAELDGVLCSGGLRGKQHTYALLEERAPGSTMPSHDEALAMLAQRFFGSHGPATVQDFAWWSGLTVTDASKGLTAIKEQLHSVEMDHKTYWCNDMAAPAHSPAVHLLPNYDEYVVAYTDRTTLFNTDHTQHLDSRKNPLFNNVIVVHGVIAGTWKPAIKKNDATIATKLFEDLPQMEAALLEDASKRYRAFAGHPGF